MDQPRFSKERMPVYAILPAAGRSRRMGQPKQLLDAGGRPMLRSVLEPLAASDAIDCIVVVTHQLIADRLDLTAFEDVEIVLNNDERTEMIDSIRMGLETIEAAIEKPLSEAECGILVVPGDQPGLSATDIRRCVDAYREGGENIVIGTWRGRRGHPIVFPSSLVPFVMSEVCNTGLRELPRQHASRVRTVECGSAAAVRNINTASDYETFRESKRKGNSGE